MIDPDVVLCAWCEKRIGTTPTGKGTSHGICKACSALVERGFDLEPKPPEGGCPRCGTRRFYKLEGQTFTFVCPKCKAKEVDGP